MPQWLVVHVAPPKAAAPAGADHVTEAFELAEELGTETALLTSEDVVREILDCATEQNVTQIVVGRSARRWRFLTLQGSLANVLQREARNVDITVAAATDSRETPERVRLPPVCVVESSRRRRLRDGHRVDGRLGSRCLVRSTRGSKRPISGSYFSRAS